MTVRSIPHLLSLRGLVPVVAAALLAPAAARAADAGALGCLIEPSRVADVGTAAAGVLGDVSVERGDMVRKGQVLATLRADVERAQVGLAESRAKGAAEIEGARQALDYARKKQARQEDLVRQNFISRQALDQAIADTQVAEARLRQALEQGRHNARELNLASAQLDNRTLRSPIDGIVVERWRSGGERVEDKPVLRVATIDPLRVEMVLPASLFGRVQTGASATVKPELPQIDALQGTVSRVDRVIDPASNTFRARLDLPNPGGKVPAGLRCSVQFAGIAAPAPTGAPAPAADRPAHTSSTAPTGPLSLALSRTLTVPAPRR